MCHAILNSLCTVVQNETYECGWKEKNGGIVEEEKSNLLRKKKNRDHIKLILKREPNGMDRETVRYCYSTEFTHTYVHVFWQALKLIHRLHAYHSTLMEYIIVF